MRKILNVGLIGCGHIAETYFRAHKYFNNFKIVKCADINLKAAKRCAQLYGIEFSSVNDLLEDNNIKVVLNLTIPTAHYTVAKKSLFNGKHVYSEKPLAVNFKEGQDLIRIAKKKNYLLDARLILF